MNLSGKTCLITGANSGLGFSTAKQFAELGANLILLCRNREKGEDAVKEIKKKSVGVSIELMICDLASIKSVRNFTDDFKKNYDRLDILFNNAVIAKKKHALTSDGLETMFQTNYLAIFQLTNSLLDLLKKSSSTMIINIAIPPYKYRLDFEDLQSIRHYKPMGTFWLSKLCALLYTLELAQRLVGTNVTVNSIDPGPFKSNIFRETSAFKRWAKSIVDISADKAAEKIVYYATSDELRHVSGKIFIKNKVKKVDGKLFIEKKEKPTIYYWEDKKVRGQLWTISQSIIDNKLQ